MQYDCLIVDDEVTLVESTSEYFNLFGIKTITACSADECLLCLQENRVRLILLDINLGNDSGFELCKQLREHMDIPIVFISARSSDDDVILALHIGGDGYIQKPYSLGVLLAKVQAVLKRCSPKETGHQIYFGDCIVDLKTEMVYRNNSPVPLKSMEQKLLLYCVKNIGRTIPKEEIFKNVWQDSITGDNTLNVHIRHLREKIEHTPNEPQFLKTVWGIGYIFVLEDKP